MGRYFLKFGPRCQNLVRWTRLLWTRFYDKTPIFSHFGTDYANYSLKLKSGPTIKLGLTVEVLNRLLFNVNLHFIPHDSQLFTTIFQIPAVVYVRHLFAHRTQNKVLRTSLRDERSFIGIPWAVATIPEPWCDSNGVWDFSV